MNLTSYLIFALPVALVTFKLVAMSLAVVWLVRCAFELPSSRSAIGAGPLLAAPRPRNPQA